MTARAYAEALYSLAADENCAIEVYRQLPAVCFAFEDNPDFCDILDRPCSDLGGRYCLINRCFTDINIYLLNCIKVMCKRRIISLFVEVANEFMNLYRKDNGIEKVTVITAEPLSKELVDLLKSKMEKKLSKIVEITLCTDASIMGGIIIRTESAQIDSSIRTRLTDIEKQIKAVVLE